jgi:hypothetical protein
MSRPAARCLTTDASLTAILEERAFLLDREITLIFGPDETVTDAVGETGRHFTEDTIAHWRDWAAGDPVRAAAAGDARGDYAAAERVRRHRRHRRRDDNVDSGGAEIGPQLDYRYRWLRDGYFVVDALNRLGATEMMEAYLGYIVNIAAGVGEDPATRLPDQGDPLLEERIVESPPDIAAWVRCGKARAVRQTQHDVYGSAVLAATHIFFDERLVSCGDSALFERLETLAPRGRNIRQTGCGLVGAAWYPARAHFLERDVLGFLRPAGANRQPRGTSGPGGQVARRCRAHRSLRRRALLQQGARDVRGYGRRRLARRKCAAARRIGLRHAGRPALRRHGARDRKGAEARRFRLSLRRRGRLRHAGARIHCLLVLVRQRAGADTPLHEARELFTRLLACRTRHGLFAEHLDFATGEQWGNFVQTYSMVGLITAAIRLSLPWDQAF